MRRTYYEIRRMLTVLSVSIDLLVDVFISYLYRPRGLRPRSLGRRALAGFIRRLFRRPKNFARFPVLFRQTLERLGPTYVKFGQILSLRDDILPERLTRELRKLQTQVPPIPYAEAKAVIEQEFNTPIRHIFAEFQETPIASASLAQAHIARLRNGEKVVVKVQRPGITRLISDDINIMRRLAAIMERIPRLRDYRPAHFVEEFAKYTMRELDFAQEGKHADIFRENFKDWPDIMFPKIYWEYTSRRVLTMEFIEGVKPDDREKLRKLGINGPKLAARGAQAILKMLYIDGFFHGDPHPGNIFIVDRTKFCLIDLGMIGSFSPETRQNMFLYYYFTVIREFEHATSYLVKLTEPGRRADVAGFRAEWAEYIKRWSNAAAFKEYSLGRLIFDTMNLGAKHRLYFHGDLVLSSKCIITIEAVGAILDPKMDLAKVSRPMMEKIFMEQMSVARYGKSILRSLPDYLEFAEKLPEQFLRAIGMISSGKFQVEVTRHAEKEKRERSNHFNAMGLVSLCLAAIFLIRDDLFNVHWSLPAIGSVSAAAVVAGLSSFLFFMLARRTAPE
ncbi:MAG: AarF/UbiB family protein [Turneriella sp.]|nr:AarF/UbiB family protein [Turneriella sp.]